MCKIVSKVKMCKIDTDFNRHDIDSDTTWPTVRGIPNQIINLHQPPRPPPFYLVTPLLALFLERLTSSS